MNQLQDLIAELQKIEETEVPSTLAPEQAESVGFIDDELNRIVSLIHHR